MNQQFIPLHDIFLQIEQLHIASLVAHVRPEQLAVIRDWIAQQPQHPIHVEIHAENSQGKLVLVTESVEETAIVNFLDELRCQTGVLNAALVYHEYLSQNDLLDAVQQEENI